MRPEGALVAMATPFRSNGTIHRPTLRSMVDFLIERGVDGLFAASTVGEFVHLSASQRYELISLTVEYAGGRVPVVGGAGDISPARVIEHCREIRRAGASFAAIAPPYYYPMGQSDLAAHYERIAGSIEIPFILYNIPQFSNPLSVETMLKVVETCSPAGLKNSNTSVVEMMELLHALKSTTVSYLVGPDELLFTGLELGASGCMSGMTGVLPEVIRSILDGFRAGRIEYARKMQFAVLELLQIVAGLPFPQNYKLMLQARGFDMGPPVHAQSRATVDLIEQRKPAVVQKLEAILKEIR